MTEQEIYDLAQEGFEKLEAALNNAVAMAREVEADKGGAERLARFIGIRRIILGAHEWAFDLAERYNRDGINMGGKKVAE